MIVVGIDPGGRWTGIVAMRSGNYLGHRVVDARQSQSFERYMLSITGWVRGTLYDVLRAGERYHVAVEGLVEPNPHMGMTNVRALIDTAQVLGALRMEYRETVLVRPGGHGSLPRQAYPPELIGPREGAALKGVLRHCRSAWDVAMAARQEIALRG
jgi:hypothetical protein